MTSFALVNVFQNRENYAWDNGICDTANPYWKFKGATEVVVTNNLSLEAVQALGSAGIAELAMAQSELQTKPNGYFEYDFLEFTLVELSDAVVDAVMERILSCDEGYDRDLSYFIYNSYELNLTEYAVEWAINELVERKAITIEGVGHTRYLSVAELEAA